MATLVLTYFILPLVMSLWFYSTHMMSWALATALILTWEVAISWCFNVQNPFINCPWGTGPLDATMCSQSIYIYGIFVIMLLVSALIGSFIGWIMDLPDVIPFSAIFPLSQREASNDPVARPPGLKNQAGQVFAVKTVSLKRWGIANIPPPYAHTIFTMFMFGVTVLAPQVIYAVFMDDTDNNNAIALGCIIGIPVIGYLATFVVWWFFPSVYVFGPCERNYKKLGAQYRFRESDDPSQWNTEVEIYRKSQRDSDTAMAHMRIAKTILVIGIFHVASNIILGVLRYENDQVNVNWITAAIWIGVLLIVSVVVALVLYSMRKPENSGVYLKPTPVPVLDASGQPMVPEDQSNGGSDSNDQSMQSTDTAVPLMSGAFMQNTQMIGSHQQLSQRITRTGIV